MKNYIFFLFIELEDNDRHAIWNMHVVSISDLSEYEYIFQDQNLPYETNSFSSVVVWAKLR